MNYIAQSWKALLVTAALTLPTLAFAADPAMMKDGMMVDHKGMTLYTFDKDSGGKSVCTGECAKHWPPFKAEAGAKAEGKWTVVQRDDGTMQWAYFLLSRSSELGARFRAKLILPAVWRAGILSHERKSHHGDRHR